MRTCKQYEICVSSHSQQHRHSAASARWTSRAHIMRHHGYHHYHRLHQRHHCLMHLQRKQRVGMSVGRSVGRSCRCAGALRHAALAPQQTPALSRKLTQRTGIFARSTRLRQHGRSHYSSLLVTAAIRSSSTRIISCAFHAQVRIKRCSCAAV